MGFYQGDGIISSGSSTGSPAGSFTTHNGQVVFLARRTNVTVTKYPGVERPDPLTNAEYGMRAMVFPDRGWSSSEGVLWDTPHLVGDYDGTKTDYSYAQIGDSNLYELVKTVESVSSWINNNYRVYG